MSKMKHLLRKLHIGGGLNEHQRLSDSQPATRPTSTPCPNSNSSVSPSSGSSSSVAMPSSTTMEAVESVVDRTASGDVDGGCVDFNALEEEFQMQLAMAISASDPDSRQDTESAQIDAAKRMSLGCSPSISGSKALAEFLSLQYWSYNVVNYDEKVMDGFYDLYGITANSSTRGKMPLLVDLKEICVTGDIDYEVILVNRFLDPELQQLERQAYNIFMDCGVSEHGFILSGLVQKLADVVVARMGGPVGDAEEMLRRWTLRSYELRSSLNTIILPLGRLDIGLARHRALLFKVLADRINLPCILVKGSYYTGTDDGAVNMIKVDNGSEYIIDLMGAPGTLIPSEAPSGQFSNYGFDRRPADVIAVPEDTPVLKNEGAEAVLISSTQDGVENVCNLVSKEASDLGVQSKENGRNFIEEILNGSSDYDFEKLLESESSAFESSSGACAQSASAQKKKVKKVSKYVISAAKNPEFAQKLHAVLLESGASPPADLFSDIDSQGNGERKAIHQMYPINGKGMDVGLQCNPFVLASQGQSSAEAEYLNNLVHENKQKASTVGSTEEQKPETNANNHGTFWPQSMNEGFVFVDVNGEAGKLVDVNGTLHREHVDGVSLTSVANSHKKQLGSTLVDEERRWLQDNRESPSENLIELDDSNLHASDGHSETINPILGEVAEWEIPWEDLHIGERIGIGSYGEVYRADWNGTEVAVKKFLDQDFSGAALVQLKCEVEIMLRLRHPNVVLFMGAVTRPPHFSILTEFLPRGSLYRLLHRPNSQLDERRRLRMAFDVAKGMNYLHTSHPTIVHRDLKSPNLLVDKNWVVKVCDFGLSRVKQNTFLSSKSTAGTPEWMAPEVLRNEPANEKCDVYSFGVILWELTTCRIPWKGLNPMQVVGAVGFQNRRLEIPEDVDPAVAQIICDCWQTDTQLRPSFSQLITRLRRLQRLVRKTNSGNLISE
ncbi:probable serine/threonine-protein kinase SIS8 [Cucurbita moschata]|uniref:non-specific serine/threonine protein kinase n=1 Tax=Cucurbita moschata TaxID=3662 RepID=A0A6J1FJI6_CUCMO|nr:probable serine/threonine-protein kinase SIS8 [Cucurbita moschata]